MNLSSSNARPPSSRKHLEGLDVLLSEGAAQLSAAGKADDSQSAETGAVNVVCVLFRVDPCEVF